MEAQQAINTNVVLINPNSLVEQEELLKKSFKLRDYQSSNKISKESRNQSIEINKNTDSILNLDKLDEYDENDEDIISFKQLIKNSENRHRSSDKYKEEVTIDLTDSNVQQLNKKRNKKAESSIPPFSINSNNNFAEIKEKRNKRKNRKRLLSSKNYTSMPLLN